MERSGTEAKNTEEVSRSFSLPFPVVVPERALPRSRWAAVPSPISGNDRVSPFKGDRRGDPPFLPLSPADPIATAKEALLPECCSAGTLSRDPRLAVLGICTQRYGHRNAIPRFLLVRVCAVSNSTCACVWAFGEVCLTDTLRNAEICVCVRSACLRGSARA